MTPPTVADFKAQFVRDFPYGTTSDKVMDADIQTAITEAAFTINESLFDTQANYSLAYGYLAAHCLVTNIKNSSQGLSGNFAWLEASKGVGSISQSFAIPENILKNPMMAMLSKTSYGAKYLSLVLPLLTGRMGIVMGDTQS